MPQRRIPRASVLGLLVLGLLVAPGVPAAGEGVAPAQKPVELTDRAAELIQEGEVDSALELLAQAIEADEDYWEAHYQKGRALGLQERFDAALESLLRAASLNPGHGHTHYLAWLAAYRLEDWENAWDQAIKASQAGQNMNPRFLDMYQRSEPPENFEIRIRAPTVFVGRPDASEIESRSEVPFNRNPDSGVGPDGGGIGTISGRPASVQGRDRLKENIADIDRLQRIAREVLADSPFFGVVLDPQRADYVLGIGIEELGESAPVHLEGYLRLYDTASGEADYFRSVLFRDITQTAMVHGELERYVEDLGEWSRKQESR